MCTITPFYVNLRYEPAGGRLRLVVYSDGEDTNFSVGLFSSIPLCECEMCSPARRTPRPCSVCGSPRLCRRREPCLIMAHFGRWPLAWRKISAVSMFDLAVQFVALCVG